MSTIHQRLRDEHGLAVSVQSFRRYVAANVPEEIRRAQVVVWNPRPAEAGEQAQIDYGQLGRWLEPGHREAPHGLGVRHGPGVFSGNMFVRPVAEDGPAGLDRVPCRGVRVLRRRRPSPAGPGQPEDRGWTSRTCMTRRSTGPMPSWPPTTAALIDPARARSSLATRRESSVRLPYVRDSFWRGPGVHIAGADASRGGTLVRRGRRAPGMPSAGGRRPGRGVRERREGLFAAAARRAVRAGQLGAGERSARISTPRSNRGSLLGALGAHRARPADVRLTATMVAVLHRRAAGQDPPPQGPRKADRLRRLPRRRRSRSTCGPRPGAAARPRASGQQCEQVIGDLLAEKRRSTGCAPAQGVVGLAEPARPGPARSRLREGAGGRGPVLPEPSRASWAAGTERAQQAGRGRGRRRGGVPARPGLVRQRHPPCPAPSPAMPCTPPPPGRQQS